MGGKFHLSQTCSPASGCTTNFDLTSAKCCLSAAWKPLLHIKYSSSLTYVNTDLQQHRYLNNKPNPGHTSVSVLCYFEKEKTYYLQKRFELWKHQVPQAMPTIAGKQQQQTSEIRPPPQQTLPQFHDHKGWCEVQKGQSSYYHECEQNFCCSYSQWRPDHIYVACSCAPGWVFTALSSFSAKYKQKHRELIFFFPPFLFPFLFPFHLVTISYVFIGAWVRFLGFFFVKGKFKL